MNRDKLYQVALSFLGKEASPLDRAPDDLACAESVNNVHRIALGVEIGGDLSTTKMYVVIQNSHLFYEVTEPGTGDIVLSPTGYVKTPNGHVGIMGDEGVVMSNNSLTGLWDKHIKLEDWKKRYGFVRYYRCTEPLPPPPPASLSENPNRTELTKEEAKWFSTVLSWISQKISKLWYN